MPRAFLVVKQKEDDLSLPEQTPAVSGEKRSRPEDEDEHLTSANFHRETAPQNGVSSRFANDFCHSHVRPSPTSSPEAPPSSSEPRSSPEPVLESRPSPRDHYGLVQTTGAHFSQVNGVFDMSQKKPRMDFPGHLNASAIDQLSPNSTHSDSAGSEMSTSSSPRSVDHHRYMLPRPRSQMSDRRSPLEAFHEHKRDMVEPLSPLHHLVQRGSPHKAPAMAGFPHGAFGFPLPPMGMAFPAMANPMFLPHHFRPYPAMGQMGAAQGPFRPRHGGAEKAQVKQGDVKEEKCSPRPRISHNIEDLLARSPPKAKKPVEVPTTVHQHRPVPIVAQTTKADQDKTMDKPMHNASNPMQKLVEMDKMLAQSPRSMPFPSFVNQSPKSGSFPPEMHPEHKTKNIQRNLELSFQKHGMNPSIYPSMEALLPDAMRQRQQLAQNYDKLLHLQRTHEKLMKSIEPESDKLPKERRSFEYVPDINKNHCFSDVHDFGSETVFPRRHGDEDKDLAIHDRLSPGLLENVPVDFTSKASHRKPGPPRFQCDGCKKSYSTLNGLSKHKEFHCVSHVKKEFSCKHCNKTYTSLGALKMHIRTHTLPCKCQICGKAFSRPWLLQGHIRTHTGEKPFSCQHCNRAFADRSNLRAHLQTHTDIKRYSCQTCTKTFSRMSLLTKHKENGCVGMHH